MTRNCAKQILQCAAVVLLFAAGVPARADDDDLRAFFEEVEIQSYLWELSKATAPRGLVIQNATLLPMNGSGPQPGTSVVVADGRIARVGPHGEVDTPAGALVVDGNGLHVMPGLVDMHVHTMNSDSQKLLNLANGVTTVRELCGFEWTLRVRELIRANGLLAPNLYASGRLITSHPMGMYAVTVETSEDARVVVRRHVDAGFDFIKVHNVLDPPLYDAVAAEAALLGVDMVGHCPHFVSLERAIAAGQRTFEHFKGYYSDRTLEMTEEDYVRLTDGAEIWNCPTFYTHRIGARDDAAYDLLAGSEMRYVSQFDRREWRELAATPINDTYDTILERSRLIFEDLLAVDARFIAGTDCGGGYPFMVPGFALHEELALMSRYGMGNAELLRAATVEASRAMREEDEFGTVEVGKRADLLVLAADPLEDPAHLKSIHGVVVRGIWLPRETLDDALAAIEHVYNTADVERWVDPRGEDLERLVERMTLLGGAGYVFKTHQLEYLRDLVEARGRDDLAAGIAAVMR